MPAWRSRSKNDGGVAIDPSEHRGEGFRSVAQQLDLVAGDQRSVH